MRRPVAIAAAAVFLATAAAHASCSPGETSGGMHCDRSGRWVNELGGNLYGDSRFNLDADPRLNPRADPRLNLDADPRLNLRADPRLHLEADPDLHPWGAGR